MARTCSGGRVAVNAGPDYVVDVYRDDRPVRSLRHPLEPERVTAELAAAELGEGMTIGSERCTVPAREVVEKRGRRTGYRLLGADPDRGRVYFWDPEGLQPTRIRIARMRPR